MKVNEFLKYCLQISPLDLQESWDNSGAQILFPDTVIKKVLIATDFTKSTLQEAIRGNFQVLVVHHPPFFKPLRSIDFSNPFHQLIMTAIQNKISVIALHTNFDATQTGMNEFILQKMGITHTTPFLMQTGNYSKLIVFVPKSHFEVVREAICNAGAGHIGNYSDCTFSTNGLGTFKGNAHTNPFLGKSNQLEVAEESKIETIIKNSEKNKILKALLKAHPYEEVAYDLVPLSNEKPGLGRIGHLPKPLKPKAFVDLIKNKLKISDLRFSMRKEPIQKVAIITGGAGSYYKDAIKNNCDAYISGDIKHNEWIEANELNLLLIDATHFETEKYFAPSFIENFNRLKLKNSPFLKASLSEKRPFHN